MPDGNEPITVKVVSRIGDVDAAEWDDCATQSAPDGNPSVGFAFLHALEESQSVRRESGWQAQHLVVEDAAGRTAGAVPMYLKAIRWVNTSSITVGRTPSNAQAATTIRSYRSLCLSHPVTGPRLLVRPNAAGAEATRAALVAGMIEWTSRNDLSSLHVTFPTKEEADYLERADFLIRHNHQYHWYNRGYETFDDFLASLNSRKRKMIRRERRKVVEAGVEMQCLSGDALKSEHWDAFYRFYTDTYDRKWGYPYLTREFFEIISDTMANNVVLVLASTGGLPIAGALNLKGNDTLFGRNWGCIADYKFLHFETCYYCAIEYAIDHGLARVEAGTQGPHKLQRGYEPVQTRSAHWIPDPGFREAVARFLTEERREEAIEMGYLEHETPYRQDVRES